MPLIAIANHGSMDDAPARRRSILWARPAVVASTAAVCGVGLLLLLRRLSGALTAYPDWRHVALAAVIAGATVWLGRAAWRRLSPLGAHALPQAADFVLAYSGSVALVLLAAAICLPSFRLSYLAVWLPLVVADHFFRQSFLTGGRFRLLAPDDRDWNGDATQRGVESPRAAPESRRGDSPDASRIPAPAPPCEGAETQIVLQQLVRVREISGEESIHGTLQAEFVAGQRHAVVHVGFCPPLARAPQIDVAPRDDHDAQVKVVQAFCHGARLEVRLAGPAEDDCQVAIEFAARPGA